MNRASITVDQLTEGDFLRLEAFGFAFGLRLGRMQHFSTALTRAAIQEYVQRRLDNPETREVVAEILTDWREWYSRARHATPGYRHAIDHELARRDAEDLRRARDDSANLTHAVADGKAIILDGERERRRSRKERPT